MYMSMLWLTKFFLWFKVCLVYLFGAMLVTTENSGLEFTVTLNNCIPTKYPIKSTFIIHDYY